MQYFNILVHYPSLTGWTGTGPYVGAYVLPVLVFCLRLLVSNSNCIATPPQMKDPPDPVLLITLLLLAVSLLLADPTPAALLRPCVSLGKIDDSISLPVPRRPHPDHNVPGSHAPMGMFASIYNTCISAYIFVHSNRSLVCASSYFPFIYNSYYLLTN